MTEGSGTCGNGKIGDGICAGVGECCSRWGWCGFTSDYCDDTAPTDNSVDPNLGKCGFGNGVTGDGTCTGENECCSVHGYCGTGDQYCSVTINTETNESSDGKCGGGGVGEGKCFLEDHCCSEYGVRIITCALNPHLFMTPVLTPHMFILSLYQCLVLWSNLRLLHRSQATCRW